MTGLQVPDCAVKNGIPVTTVPRTIIDLARTLRPDRLEEVLDHALSARSVSLEVLEQRLAKTGTQGRRGAGVLDGLIAARLVGSPRARQRAERLFIRIVQRYGLPIPEREVEYHLSDGRTVYVDFVFCRVVGAEIDSYLHHSSLTDWAADRSRNNLLRAQGLTLLNVTEPDMRSDPAGVAAQFEEALVSRGGPMTTRWAPRPTAAGAVGRRGGESGCVSPKTRRWGPPHPPRRISCALTGSELRVRILAYSTRC